jgi:uncharacterized membrane protein
LVSEGEQSTARSGAAGVLAASAILPGTFARSLTPRTWVDQGIITGSVSGLTYLLTVISHDSVEALAARLAPALPLPPGIDGDRRERAAVLAVNLGLLPAGLIVQRVLAPRLGEPLVRAITRQVTWRWMATGLFGSTLTAAEGAAALLDRRLGADGRVARFPVAVPAGLGLALVVESRRQRNIPDTAPDDSPLPLLPSLGLAGGLVLVGSAAAYGERRLSHLVGETLAGVLPGSSRIWKVTGGLTTLGALGLSLAALWRHIVHQLETGATAIDPVFTSVPVREIVQESSSGSEASRVSWESLGREGRRHIIAAVRPVTPIEYLPRNGVDLSIPAVMGEPARANPVQVYVGLDAAPTAQERVDLALAEMDRTNAWDRSLIMLVSPTGTGYVNYCAVAAVQYLSRGDVATVTLQYSKRPSPLSLGKIAGAREQNRLLWLRILDRVRHLPPEQRPRIVLFGESLGAHTSQDVFLHWGTLGPQALGIDRALWVGTPYASGWMQQVTGPPRTDVDPELVAVVNDFGQVEAMPPERRSRLRYVFLSHDNDGVTKFGLDLIVAPPRWLGEERPPVEQQEDGVSPRGIPPSMRWRPLTTFLQLLIDMKNAQIPGTYRAYAHDYRPDLARFVREVYDLPCSEEQLQRVEDALRAREDLRVRLFETPPTLDDRPQTVGGG